MKKISLSLLILLLAGCNNNRIPDINEQLMQQVIDLQDEMVNLRRDMRDKATWFNTEHYGATPDEKPLSESQKQELILRAKEAILLRRDDLTGENLIFTNSEEVTWPEHSFYVHFQQVHKGQAVPNSHAAVEIQILTGFCPVQRINAYHLLPPLD